MTVFKSDRNRPVNWAGVPSFITFVRTYSRRLKEDDPNSPTESFHQTVDRIVNACNNQLGVGFTNKEQRELSEILLDMKGMVAGRFLWQLGTKTVDRLGLLSLQNCAFTVVDHPIEPFTWAMDALMLGAGVGFNIQHKNIDKLPPLKGPLTIIRKDSSDADFIVPDTREGWVKLLGKVLKAHFYKGEGFTYSTQLIRGKGALIKGFGGVSSGPEELCWGLGEISNILNKRAGTKLRPIDALDIMNIIGNIVVAGNVRRSAQIAIGDANDTDFLMAKRWDLEQKGLLTIPKWRYMSNNSVICSDTKELPDVFWETYSIGEPYGLINLNLARKVGRLGETQYPDPNVEGFNPCITGDTLVAVADGRNAVPIKDLVGTEYPVYSIENGKVSIQKSIKTWKTRENAEIWKLTLDDGSVLKATPDHLIMLRNGEYKMLKDLQAGESLMPFNSYVSNRYRQISSNIKRDRRQYRMIAEYNGIIHSEESKKKTSEKLKGRIFSEEHCDKLKQAALQRYNHKVISVEFLGYEDVYDMTVENTHNFGVITSTHDEKYITSSGIFIHNCAEQSLENKETCCLSEIYLPNIKSQKELIKVAKYLYRINKHSLALPSHQKSTEKIVHRNMRMGIGITGVLQSSKEQLSWLDKTYRELRDFDVEYSKEKGFPISIKLTTVKPSGTLSLLAGVTPGIHPSPAGPYYIRRIRMSSMSPLVPILREHGYPVEYMKNQNETEERHTVVVSFPCSVPEGTPIGDNFGAIQHLELVKDIQTKWSDNSVSVTVYYKPEELESIKEWLHNNYKDSLKTVSFLLYYGHGFIQAPYETITKEKYDEIVSKIKPITGLENITSFDDMDNVEECDSGACPVR